MFVPPTPAEAKRILLEEIAKFGSRIDPIMDTHDGPRREARALEWWLKDAADQESATTDRNVAYLRTYLRLAGPRPMWTVGIPLTRQRVYLDRSVMRRLHRDGFVRYVEDAEPFFEITEAGRRLVAE